MPMFLKQKPDSTFLKVHIRLVGTFAFLGGFLFLGWGVIVSTFENPRFEIWPIRIGIAVLLWILGGLARSQKFSLLQIEWMLSALGSCAIIYAFDVSWRMGFHPTWIAGSMMIIVGILSVLSYWGPMFVFAGVSLALSVSVFVLPPDQLNLMNPISVFLNFMTAIVLATYSSIQRNRLLAEVHRAHLEKEALYDSARLAALGEMSAGIAHEINNPLSAIIGSSEQIQRRLLQVSSGKEEIQQRTEIILRMAERVSRIIKSMLSLSSRSELSFAGESNVRTVLANIAEVCTEGFAQEKIDFSIDVQEDLYVSTPPGMLGQVLMNLIYNSRDAVRSQDERWIRVQAQRVAGAVKIRVTDSGLGIPEDLKAKVMQPFFTTKDIGQGPGLGLSMAHAIVVRNQGTLVLDSSARNTSFVVTLPSAHQELLKTHDVIK